MTLSPKILAIGSSTGGPAAIIDMLRGLKGIHVPIIITQHMPKNFTTRFAARIEEETGIPCSEGADGMVLFPGHAYVAPGGFHMLFERVGFLTTIRLSDGPSENFCKPSVDPMIRSAMEIYGCRILTVILTGMGKDGLKSCEQLVAAGGQVIAQDEETSVIWGMPGAVAKAGICSAVLPLDDIAGYVQWQVKPRRARTISRSFG